MFIAVETSDLVHSTKMSEENYSQAIGILKKQLAHNQTRFNARFDIFRGDAFQVVYQAPEHALRAALMTRFKLMYSLSQGAVEVTQALSFGVQEKVDDAFSEAMGEVFINSGRLLETTKRRQIQLVFQHIDNKTLVSDNGAIGLIVNYLNMQLLGITQKQAQVLFHYLDDDFPEQQLIADKLNITRQNVAAHLKRGGADLLKQTIHFFEDASKRNTTIQNTHKKLMRSKEATT